MRGRGPRGLTMIELMSTLAVAGVLVSLGLPSFREAVLRARLSAAASELVVALESARVDASTNRGSVVMCRSSDGSTCSSTNNTWPGWMVFLDSDGDGVRDASEPVLRVGSFDASVVVKSSAAVTARNEQLVFSNDGLARASNGRTLLNATLSICTVASRPAENARDVSMASGSRINVRRRNGSGACDTPSDA